MVVPSQRDRPLGAWCSVTFAVLLVGTLAPPVLAQEPPPIPSGGTGEQDDLALVPREWTETNRNGTVVDLVGTSQEVPSWEVAYRIHGDIAAIEGSLLADADTLSPRPIFNPGLRLDRIEFAPPLRFDDGSELATLFPPGGDWAFDNDSTIPPQVYGFTADAAPNHTADLTLRFRAQMPASAATVHLSWALAVRSDRLAAGTDLNETTAEFRFLFDFGDEVPARTAGPERFDTEGAYLIRGDASATFRVFEDGHNVTFRAPASTGPFGNETRLVRGPIHVAVSAPVANVAPMTHVGWQDGYRVSAQFGFLVDLPEPVVPSSDPTENGDTSGPALPVILLLLLAMFLLVRRTEANR